VFISVFAGKTIRDAMKAVDERASSVQDRTKGVRQGLATSIAQVQCSVCFVLPMFLSCFSQKKYIVILESRCSSCFLLQLWRSSCPASPESSLLPALTRCARHDVIFAFAFLAESL
jgi:hypothetical protein